MINQQTAFLLILETNVRGIFLLNLKKILLDLDGVCCYKISPYAYAYARALCPRLDITNYTIYTIYKILTILTILY